MSCLTWRSPPAFLPLRRQKKGTQWQQVISLLDQMGSKLIKASLIGLSATVSACDKGE